MGTSHSPKLPLYRNLTIRFFSVISRTLVERRSWPSIAPANCTKWSDKFDNIKYYGRALSSISEGVTRLARAGRMTCKVGRDFKIITDVLSRVLLVTSNIRGSPICSTKSLYKKTSNEILRELKAAFKTGESKVSRPLSVLPSLLWQAGVKQPALTHTPSPPRGREKKDAT